MTKTEEKMTFEQLVSRMCDGCRYAEWFVDADNFGHLFGYIEGCRKGCEPFYNEESESADCNEWEEMKDD